MNNPADIIEAAREIRPFLNELLGNRAKDAEAELEALLEQKTQSQKEIADKILNALSRHDKTREWLIKFLTEKQNLRASSFFIDSISLDLLKIEKVSGENWFDDRQVVVQLIEMDESMKEKSFAEQLEFADPDDKISPAVKTFLAELAKQAKNHSSIQFNETRSAELPQQFPSPTQSNVNQTRSVELPKPTVPASRADYPSIQSSEDYSSSESTDYLTKLGEQFVAFSKKNLEIISEGIEEITRHFDMSSETQPESPPVERQSAPPKRYADFTLYRESSPGLRGARVENGKPLKNKRWYQLEAAIREKTTGIPAQGERLPVREPQQTGDAEILVTAHSDDFEIQNPVQFLVLPARGDSINSAVFRVCPQETTVAANQRSVIHLRMYYEFNLLEAVDIHAEIVNPFDSEISNFGLSAPISFEQTRTEGGLFDFENVVPRQMHIDISVQEGVYVFTFAFCKNAAANKDEDKLVMTAPVQIGQAELESDLVELRKALLNMTTSETYIKQLEAQNDIEFARMMNRLARSGRNLWTKLFRREKNSAMWNVGLWLKKHPLALNSKIQISTQAAASNFVFPWNLIYDGAVPGDKDEAPDLNGFWGLRYEIEQRLPNKLASDAPVSCANEFEIGFMLWHFKQASEQQSLIADLTTRGKGRIARNGAITKARDAYQYFEDCNSHILYFFTHGHTQILESNSGGGLDLKHFQALYQALPADSPLRENWKLLYEEIEANKFEADRSWIELSIGKIYLDELYDRDVNLKHFPIVILNMCESAQITPSLAENSFIHFFLDRGASGVVGTECLMTPLFAHHFAKKLLETLLSGKSIGEAMLEARREFVNLKNPLGLAYTLFGSTTQKIVPPPLQSLN